MKTIAFNNPANMAFRSPGDYVQEGLTNANETSSMVDVLQGGPGGQGGPNILPVGPMWRENEQGQPVRYDQISENLERWNTLGKRHPVGPPVSGGISTSALVDIVSSYVTTQNPGRVDPVKLRALARTHIPAACEAVDYLERQSGRAWAEKELAQAFQAELLKLVQTSLIELDTDGFSDRIAAMTYGASIPVGGGEAYNPITGNIESGTGGPANNYYNNAMYNSYEYGGGSSSSGGGNGIMSTLGGPGGKKTIIHIDSKDRSTLVGTLPNTMVISLPAPDVVNLSYLLKGLKRIELLEARVHRSPAFASSPNGARFYIEIDELPTTVVRQSDGHGTVAQFLLVARPMPRFGPSEVQILTNCVDLFTPINMAGMLTIRFLDRLKRPLPLEHDAFAINSYAWDDINFRIIFTLDYSGIRSGDEVSIRGFICTQDTGLFSDDKNLKAVMLAPTQMAIYQWRPPPRAITTHSAAVICMNNTIHLSLMFTHGY